MINVLYASCKIIAGTCHGRERTQLTLICSLLRAEYMTWSVRAEAGADLIKGENSLKNIWIFLIFYVRAWGKTYLCLEHDSQLLFIIFGLVSCSFTTVEQCCKSLNFSGGLTLPKKLCGCEAHPSLFKYLYYITTWIGRSWGCICVLYEENETHGNVWSDGIKFKKRIRKIWQAVHVNHTSENPGLEPRHLSWMETEMDAL